MGDSFSFAIPQRLIDAVGDIRRDGDVSDVARAIAAQASQLLGVTVSVTLASDTAPDPVSVAGASLLADRNGVALGWLSGPEAFSDDQRALLQRFARLAAPILDAAFLAAKSAPATIPSPNLAPLTALVRALPIGFSLTDNQHRYILLNDALAELHGIPAHEHLGRRVRDVLSHLGDSAEIGLQAVLRTGRGVYKQEVYVRSPSNPDHGQVWLVHRFPVRIGDDFLGVGTIVSDITAFRAARAALRTAEERFAAFQQTTPDGFCILESVRDDSGAIIDFRWIFANPAAAEIVGLDVPELIGHTLRETRRAVEPGGDDRFESMIAYYNRVVETGEPLSREARHYALRERWFTVNAARAGDGLAVTYSDITHRKQMEAALLESEGRLRLALTAADVGTWDFRPQTGELRWDDRCKELFGLAPDAHIDYSAFLDGLHPDDRVATDSVVQQALDPAGSGEYDIEYRTLSRSDGRIRWCRAVGRAIFDEIDGVRTAVRFIGTIQDITSQRQTEAALADVQRRLETALIAGEIGTWTWDIPADRVVADRNFAHAFALTPDEADGAPVSRYLSAVHPDDLEMASATLSEALTAGETFHVECRLVVEGQPLRWVLGRGRVERDQGGAPIRLPGVMVDITRRKAQEASIQALNERLQRSMTETHHRVKNNLQLLSALIDMQALDHDEPELAGQFRRLNAHVRTMASVHDLLTQQARRDSEANFISAQAILQKMLPMLQAMAGPRRIVATIDDIALPGRQGTSLALIANELVLNALKHGHGDIEVRFFVDETLVTLAVTDDGPGFAEDFDPEISGNTGLALVENVGRWDLGGEVRYEKGENDIGARVSLHIPRERLQEIVRAD